MTSKSADNKADNNQSVLSSDNENSDTTIGMPGPEALEETRNALKSIKNRIEEEKNALREANNKASAAEVNRINKNVAKEKAIKEQETNNVARNKQLAQSAAKQVATHKDVNYKITKHPVDLEQDVLQYNNIVGEYSLKRKALIATKELREKIEMKKNQKYRTFLRSGNKVNLHAYVQDKTRCFSKKNVPYEPNIAIALVIDESGSMGGEKSFEAMKTAIFIEEIAAQLDIPIMILGHSSSYPTMTIYQYTDFESFSDNEKYSLVHISGHNRTRDGAALLYTVAKLKERSEEKKLILIISDGSPYCSGYTGEVAVSDIQAIVKEADKSGISVVAAAIDSDKEVIKKIYGSDRFLNISDFDMLPKSFASMILRQIG